MVLEEPPLQAETIISSSMTASLILHRQPLKPLKHKDSCGLTWDSRFAR